MGKIVITDEAGAPATPADGVTIYSVASELRYLDESGVVHKVATDNKPNIGGGAVTNSMLATDVKAGSLAALTTTAKGSLQAAINEVDANADAAAAAAAQANTRIGAAASASGSIGTSVDADGTLRAGAVDVPDVIANGIVSMPKLAPDVRKVLAKPTNLYAILAPPTAFAAACAALGWSPLMIYQEADGRASLGPGSLLDYAPTGTGIWYVDGSRPDNSGDGLSWATAKRGLNYAIQAANASSNGGTIWMANGVYPYPDSIQTLAVTKNVAVRAVEAGKVVLSNHRVYSWAVDAVYTSTYVATHGLGGPNHYMVCDALYPDALGDYQALVKRTSVSDVNSNAGSWYDDGTRIYVRLSDERAPDANLRPYWSGSGSTLIRIAAGSPVVLFDGLRLEGGGSCATIQAESAGVTPVVYFHGCTFKYAADNGLNNVGADTYCQNCLAAKNVNDGFHYAERATAIRQACGMEIDCVGRHNGDGTTHISNGSTGHNAILVVRAGGNYYGNAGRNVHDVGPGTTKSWNIFCWAHDGVDSLYRSNFACGTGSSDQAMSWLDSCRSSGGGQADLETVPGTTISTRACTLRVGTNLGSGTVVEY